MNDPSARPTWRLSKAALDTMWGDPVRKLTVDWTPIVILILSFLQLDLVHRYFYVSSATPTNSNKLEHRRLKAVSAVSLGK